MKTCEEWRLAFNQYYNNITSNKAPGLEPIEISRLLTDAQNAIVIGLYNGTIGNAFESTEQVTAYLAPLVAQKECISLDRDNYYCISPKSKVYELPDDLLFITLETCNATIPGCGESEMIVVPVTQDEYWRTKNNPFKRHNKRRVLRLSYGQSSDTEGVMVQSRYAELICDYEITHYFVRYVKCPPPIVLEDFTEQKLSIDGCAKPQTCILPEALHQLILSEAVRMAKNAWNN